MEANKMIDEEITKAFGDDSVSFEQSSKEKRLLIGTQISSMALQLHITTRQLCQSYAYQTTRFYQQCVVGSIGSKGVGGNPLDALCGGFLEGSAYFRPFQKDPDDSIDEFVDYAKTYVEGLETMFSQASTVEKCVSENVWGKSSSAQDQPFLSLTIRPWTPPACDPSQGYVRKSVRVFEMPPSDDIPTSIDPTVPDQPPRIDYWFNTSCMDLVDEAESGLDADQTAEWLSKRTCATVTEWFNNCAPQQIAQNVA